MRTYTAVVERCPDTGLYVGYVPGFPGAHSQGGTMEELADDLKEIIAMLLDEGEPRLEAEFVGTQNVGTSPSASSSGHPRERMRHASPL